MSEIQKLKEVTVKDLYSLLISGNRPVTLPQLEKDYESFTGCQIPFYKLGFSDLESFLRDCPSFFRLYWEGTKLMVRYIPTADVQHIEKLVQEQKPKRSKPQRSTRNHCLKSRNSSALLPASPAVSSIVRGQIRGILMDHNQGLLGSSFNELYSKRFGMSINFSMFGFSNLLEMLESMPDIVEVVHSANGNYKVYPMIMKTKSSQSEIPDIQHSRVNEDISTRSSHKDREAISRQDGVSWQDDKLDNSGVDIETQLNIQQLLAEHKDGLWSTRFQDEYRAKYKKKLDVHHLGYISIINLMSNLPHIVTIQRANQKDWLLFDARHKKQAEPVLNEPEKGSDSQKLDTIDTLPLAQIKDAVCQVISHFPHGLPMDDLPMTFWKMTGELLIPSKLGYNDLHSLVTAMTDVIGIDYNTGSAILHSCPRTSASSVNMQPEVAFTQCSPRVASVPFDVIGPDATFKQLIITQDKLKQNNNYLEVFVATVVNPDNLWLQIKGLETSHELDKLMDRLQTTYSNTNLTDAYSLPDDLVKQGQVCVAIYPPEGSWHRCQITAIKDKDFVELFYVDYGSRCVVTKHSLKFLRWCDFELPAQAIPAKLSNVRPKNGVWTNEAKNLILSLVTDKPLFALVTDVALNGTLMVSLTDTTGDADVHITDELIDSGLAELDITNTDMSSLPPSSLEQANVNPSDSQDRSVFPPADNDRLMECERYVKLVELTADYSFHIIRYNDKPYVSTAEVSKMLWPGKGDILKIKFQQARLPLERLLIMRSENPLLFYDLFWFHVDGSYDENNRQKQFLSVIELKTVADILDISEHPCQELKNVVSSEISTFDPLSSFWTYKMDRKEIQQLLDYFQQNLDAVLKALHYKRKSILGVMKNMNTENAATLVHSQKLVEEDINRYSQCCDRLQQILLHDC